MTPAQLKAALKRGDAAPVYLLEGADGQARHELAQVFLALVDEGLQAFNIETVHAADATTASVRDQMLSSIIASARTLPMMAPRRVVLVLDADRLLSPKRAREDEAEVPPQPEAPSGGRGRKRAPAPLTASEAFEAYLQQPEPLTSLVLVAGALDASRRLVKQVRAHAITVDCGTIDSVADAAAWIRTRLEADELTLEPRALQRLVQATGLNLARIRAEIEKLVLYAAGESTITERHVRELVLSEAEPGEGFALGTAIWNHDVRGALGEIAAQLDAGAQPPMVLGQIRAAAVRLRPETRIRRAMDLVLQTDLALKTSGGTPRHLLERLVVELCGK
jgi:DNA polymerase-3 subunit delta